MTLVADERWRALARHDLAIRAAMGSEAQRFSGVKLAVNRTIDTLRGPCGLP